MLCDNCHKQANHIYSSEFGEYCDHCSDLPITSKNKTDGVLSRNSFRVRQQQLHHEGDMVQPHVYDKNLRRQVINPDFVKLYPDKVSTYFNSSELKNMGYQKMPKAIKKTESKRQKAVEQFKNDTIFSGSSKKALKKFLK